MAASRNDDIVLTVIRHFVIGFLNDGRPNRRLFNARKAELLERFFKSLERATWISGQKAWRDGSKNRRSLLEEPLNDWYIISYHFRVLRADVEALTAENAIVENNRRVAIVERDGFQRTVPNAFIAGTAIVGFGS